ncbi:hypothetical protein MACJ_002491 [Theileria orientalis]|uniref:Uncharacterized protein n=1 Tax=Theileria orientalis TaxID=68886 RepID=A0A976M6B5_THEOR|nr:hypothetical protein MACJ_002491 [Theileria orientalis]
MSVKQEGKFLYLDISHITNYKHDRYSYTHDDRKVHVTHEPNELFVRYEITNVGRISKIVYSIDNEIQTFDEFDRMVDGREIDYILVYFIRYNETPLYMSIFARTTYELTQQNIIGRRYNYRLDKNGVWKKAEHFALVFNDLKELAYEHNMFQYFEIESSDKYCSGNDGPVKCPVSSMKGNNYGDYKVYTHTPTLEKPITSLFLYRNKIIKSLIVTSKHITDVEVYYDKGDYHNRLPLLIIIHKKDEEKEYYVNEGGNYRWKKEENLLGQEDIFGLVSLPLKTLKDKLMGNMVTIDIGDYFEHTEVSQTQFEGLDVFIQDHHELGYRSVRYTDSKKRFSISKLHCEGEDVHFPDSTIYSVLEFYVFHHGSSSTPLFLCAVYEVKHDNIFVWYQLTNLDEKKYEICYFLSGDPKYFTEYKPIINTIEAKIYNIHVELIKTLTRSYNYGTKTLTNVGDINFYVTYQKKHPTHNRYIMSPAYSNYFSIKSLSAYEKTVKEVEFKSVKEIHVFEHSNLHHYKVCIVSAEYNYLSEGDSLDFHWYEIRKNTNKGVEWTFVGEPKIDMTPDFFNDQFHISALMDERISFYDGGEDVYYIEPKGVKDPKHSNIKYGNRAEVDYRPGLKWPPITPIILDPGFGKIYSTYEINPDTHVIKGDTRNLPGKEGGITPLVGGLIGSGAGVGIVGVTTGYVLYSNMGTITSALSSLIH